MIRTQEIPFARLLRNESQVDRAKSVLIEWVADRYQLNLRGRVERIGPCPVCGDVDRFAINIKKQVWNCRVCSKGGDVIALVQHLNSVDFITAVQILNSPASAAYRSRQASNAIGSDVTAYWRQQHEKARPSFAISRWSVALVAERRTIHFRRYGRNPHQARVRRPGPRRVVCRHAGAIVEIYSD
jgi:phage/plasmid primase-like uncharacterized protein